MGLKESLCVLAGVILGSILDDDQMSSGLAHHPFEKLLIGQGVEPAFDSLIEQPPRQDLHSAKDLVGFSDATGEHFGLMAFQGPRVRKGSPLWEAGFIYEKQQGVALFDLFKDFR